MVELALLECLICICLIPLLIFRRFLRIFIRGIPRYLPGAHVTMNLYHYRMKTVRVVFWKLYLETFYKAVWIRYSKQMCTCRIVVTTSVMTNSVKIAGVVLPSIRKADITCSEPQDFVEPAAVISPRSLATHQSLVSRVCPQNQTIPDSSFIPIF